MPDPDSPEPDSSEPGPPVPGPTRRGPIIALGFDFGRRRIGLAVGTTLTGSAAPLRAVAMLAGGPDWDAIGREIRAHQPHMLVVGVPYNADGTAGPMAAATRGFARGLGARFGLPVGEVDERWSSLEAQDRLREERASGQRRRRVQKQDIDSAAAAIILTRWLAAEEGSKQGE